MKVLVLSRDGSGLAMCEQLAKEDNEVLFYNGDSRIVGTGIVTVLDSWRPHFADCDLIIGATSGFGQHEEMFRRLGKVTFAISELADEMCSDVNKGIEVLERSGIPTQWSYEFESGEDALGLMDEWHEYGYELFIGDTSTVCRNRDIYQWVVEATQGRLIAQELSNGLRIRTEGWFNGRSWIHPFIHSFRTPAAGTNDEGTISVSSRGDRIVQHVLSPIEHFLRNIRYRGPFSVISHITDGGVQASRAYAAIDHCTLATIIESSDGTLLDRIYQTSIGANYAAAVGDMVAAIPVFGVGPGCPITGIIEANEKHVRMNRAFTNGTLRYAGGGPALFATAVGRDAKEARKRAYRTVANLDILEKSFPNGVGEGVDQSISQLKQQGWI